MTRVTALLSVLLFACSTSFTATSSPANCGSALVERACFCGDGDPGMQTCREDGAWTECPCSGRGAHEFDGVCDSAQDAGSCPALTNYGRTRAQVCIGAHTSTIVTAHDEFNRCVFPCDLPDAGADPDSVKLCMTVGGICLSPEGGLLNPDGSAALSPIAFCVPK